MPEKAASDAPEAASTVPDAVDLSAVTSEGEQGTVAVDELEMDVGALEAELEQVRATFQQVDSDAKEMLEMVEMQRRAVAVLAGDGDPKKAAKLSKCRVASMKAQAKKSEAAALSEEIKLLEGQLEAAVKHNDPNAVKQREADKRATELKAQIASAERELGAINRDQEATMAQGVNPRDRVKYVSIRILMRFIAKGYTAVVVEQWRANKEKFSTSTWMPAFAAHSKLQGAPGPPKEQRTSSLSLHVTQP